MMNIYVWLDDNGHIIYISDMCVYLSTNHGLVVGELIRPPAGYREMSGLVGEHAMVSTDDSQLSLMADASWCAGAYSSSAASSSPGVGAATMMCLAAGDTNPSSTALSMKSSSES